MNPENERLAVRPDEDRLVNKQLTAVTFVQDYIQLAFEELGVTFVVDPYLQHGRDRVARSDVRFTSDLVGLIGRVVVGARVQSDQSLEIDLGDWSIGASLDPSVYKWGPEAVILYEGQEALRIW